jgi:FtsH-binding integral membrane protein
MVLAFTEADHWRPGIGDPTFMGWLTVAAYFGAAVFCWMAARSDRDAHPQAGYSRHPRLWFCLAGLLTVLGVNKQLDLQTWFTLALKSVARGEGWYEQRQVFQILFILAMAVLGIIGLAILCVLIRKNLRQTLLALVGAVFLMCFVLVRASSFHHVDQMIGLRVGGLKLNWVLELGGIICIGYAAWKNWKGRQPADPDCRGFVWVTKPKPALRTK